MGKAIPLLHLFKNFNTKQRLNQSGRPSPRIANHSSQSYKIKKHLKFLSVGFIDGENYIAFKKGDVDDLCQKLTYYREKKDLLQNIQRQSLLLAAVYA